jgi:hypothetical protein
LHENLDRPAHCAYRQAGLGGQLGERWQLRGDLAHANPSPQMVGELLVGVLGGTWVDSHAYEC